MSKKQNEMTWQRYMGWAEKDLLSTWTPLEGAEGDNHASRSDKTSTQAGESLVSKKALWQVHMPPPKRIDHPHYYVTEVNKIHQADLLYLPHDKVYYNTYKYTLQVIDVASRFKVSRSLKTKKASEVAEMFKDIYIKGPLRYPKEFHVDNGTDFKADIQKLVNSIFLFLLW